ncbi:MAG: PAS domain S-box protein [Pseudomonadota bacterium]
MSDIYRQYFESLPCFLTVQDRDFRIIDANTSFKNNFGEYEGRYCYQVYKHRPEKCEVCPVDSTFRDGKPHRSEEQVTTREGRQIWVVVNTTPIRNSSGEITAVMEMSTDIDEIKNLQEELKESQVRYRLLFEEVPCYISIQDRDLRIVDANRMHREAFGTSYGSKCYKVYKHRSKECMPCIVQDTFKDGAARTTEEVVKPVNGRQMNVLVHTSPIRNADGTIGKVVEMSTDITAIRELQDKLSSVGLLIGSISHGIKGLMGGLDGGIYLVNSGLRKDDRKRIDQGWEMAMRNVARIRSMVMDILYYAKDREPDWQPLGASALAKDVCEIAEERAKNLNISFTCDIDDNAGSFEADPQAVRSMLVNLVENALDACRIDKRKKDHRVAIGLKGTADTVLFEVSDDGIGMDRETREKAFSLFFSSKGAGGTGLGLFIANKIAQAHGGRIKLESEEGEGSTFIVELGRKRPPQPEGPVVEAGRPGI